MFSKNLVGLGTPLIGFCKGFVCFLTLCKNKVGVCTSVVGLRLVLLLCFRFRYPFVWVL